MKNYFGGRGIQPGSGGKEKTKEKPFDLCKKASVIKQIQLATYAEDRKSCWRRNYKQVRANSHITPLSNYRKFLVPKTFDAWMLNLCNFPEFFVRRSRAAWPNLASVSYCYHLIVAVFFLIRSKSLL